ncbi:MAG: hypothetical protein KME49_13810 [Brasilonema octagenarum HA4186-MV1]|jgi:hypothetical protein|nr:hypothetical protein [Brasilonema octagenarum HA4186-MV1]
MSEIQVIEPPQLNPEADAVQNPAPSTIATVVLRDIYTFELKPISAWTYFLFNEKVVPPEMSNAAAGRAVGAKLAQQWLFEQCYYLNGEPLDAIKLNSLQLTMREANRLLAPLVTLQAEIELLDSEDSNPIDYTDSKHFKIGDREFTFLDIPWEACDDFYKDIQISPAQAYKNLAKKYYRVNDERLTEEMFIRTEPEGGIGLAAGKVIFDQVKQQVN